MKARFTFLERENIGIGVFKTQYETNIHMEEYPNFAQLKAQMEERILLEFGTTLEEAKEDKAYSLDFIVKKKPQLPRPMPGDDYTLSITDSGCLHRLSREFYIEKEG